jgi:hypothetical protein
MPLLDIWKATRESVLSMTLDTIVRMAGQDGQLKDGSLAADEFRQFLSEIDSEKLAEYAQYCLDNAFPNSGQVLQDVVNEIGRRLNFSVENGRYQGVRNDIGFDGIWTSKSGSLVVEVKTTDAYTIKLNVIAKYRDRLAEAGRVPADTPILLVIGRNDTESLEAQVRGSPYAWSMRIISIESLVKLMEVNLATSGLDVEEKIHHVLRPFEYTRLDRIVDLIFTTAEDRLNEVEAIDSPDEIEQQAEARVQDKTPADQITERKRLLVEALSSKLGVVLRRTRHSMYADASDTTRAVIAVSKRYLKAEEFYWYAYHDEPQRSFLSSVGKSFMVFGMADSGQAFAVPFSVLEDSISDFYVTVKKNRHEYKHIYIYVSGGTPRLRLKSGKEISLENFAV